MISALAALLLALLPGRADSLTTLKEDFESHAVGAVGTDLGWRGLWGTADSVIDYWQALDPAATPPSGYPVIPSGNDSLRMFSTTGGGSANYQLVAPFAGDNLFRDSDTVYYGVKVAPQATGGYVQDLRFGGRIGTTSGTYVFGVQPDAASNTGRFRWIVGTTLSTATYVAGHWYEAQLVIDQSAGATSATGSLAVRDVTLGEEDFTAVSGLQGISLGLSSTTKVSAWTGWSMRTYGKQTIDDLYLSTVPLAVHEVVRNAEDFESTATGSLGTGLGWYGLWGTSSSVIDAWQVLDPAATPPSGYASIPSGNPGDRIFSTTGGGSANYQMVAPFAATNSINDNDTIFYRVKVAPPTTGGSVQDMRFGGCLGTSSDIILFGAQYATSSSVFRWQVGTTVSTATYPSNHWYELELAINQNLGTANTTGSLGVRDLTLGETDFTPVAGLQGIVLGLTDTTKPSQWTGWAMRTYGRQNVDDLSLSTVPPLPVGELAVAQDAPFVHQWPWKGERELYGYNPSFTPGPVEFDNDNRPYIRAGEVIQTINDAKTGWISLNFADAIQAAYPDWDRQFAKGAFFEERVVFDGDGDAYIFVATSYATSVAPLNNHSLLLYSHDRCRTWQVYQMWNFRFVQIEHRDGHNDRSQTPIIMAADSSNLYAIKITKKADGTLDYFKKTTIATNYGGLPMHSGDGNVAVSNGNKVHIVYYSMTPVSGYDGTPQYAVTYDRTTDTVSSPVLLGFVGNTVDGHNFPAITIDSDGYLHVVYAGHHTPEMYYTKSTVPDSTAAWTTPLAFGDESVQPVWGHTYTSLICDPDDNLHVLTRWSGSYYWFRLAYQTKPAGQPWSNVQTLVVPCRGNYQVWHHKLSMDLDGNLQVFYEHEPHNLVQSQYDAYNLAFPEDRLDLEGAPPSGQYQWYYNVRPRGKTLLRSLNGGDSWQIDLTADLIDRIH